MTEYFCGESGSDAADGQSHANRWLTPQKAFDSVSAAAGGHRINFFGSITLTATPSLTTFGNGSVSAYTTLQGYTSTPGDGGIASIDGGGFPFLANTAQDGMILRNFKFTNWGSGFGVQLDNFGAVLECEFDGEGARVQALDVDQGWMIRRNKIHDMIATTENILQTGTNSFVIENYIQSTGGSAILLLTSDQAFNNVISLNSTNAACYGIEVNGDFISIKNNTIYNRAAGTGRGILTLTGSDILFIDNNIVAGFSGTGGVGILAPSGSDIVVPGHNHFWNNATDTSLTDVHGTIAIDTAFAENPFVSTDNADPNDDDFSLTEAALAYFTGLYDPDGAFGSRNKSYGDVGALTRSYAGGGGGGGISQQLINLHRTGR